MAKKKNAVAEGFKKVGNKFEEFIMSKDPEYYDTVGYNTCN